MAISFQSHVVSDLCLGKPALKSITLTSSVSDALSSLKSSDDTFISIWTSNNPQNTAKTDEIEFECKCVGKISMVDILCFLCKDENLSSPVSALHSPVSLILTKPSDLIKHVDPSTSLLDAIGLILQGAENLIVPIQPAGEYCWLTQEDLIRFILSRIGLFASLLTNSIEDLGIIKTEITALDYNSPASLAMDILHDSLSGQTSVPVVNAADGNNLVGEISRSTLAGGDESTTAAIAALSCGDFMAYIDSWGGPPKDLIKLVKSRLKGSNFEGLLIFLDDEYSSTSDDDMDSTSSSSSSSSIKRSRRHSRSGSSSFKTGRRAEEMTCHPWSSLVAVMIQAIAHRVNYGWVVDENYCLCGIVTFCDILRVFYEHMKPEFEDE